MWGILRKFHHDRTKGWCWRQFKKKGVNTPRTLYVSSKIEEKSRSAMTLRIPCPSAISVFLVKTTIEFLSPSFSNSVTANWDKNTKWRNRKFSSFVHIFPVFNHTILSTSKWRKSLGQFLFYELSVYMWNKFWKFAYLFVSIIICRVDKVWVWMPGCAVRWVLWWIYVGKWDKYEIGFIKGKNY